MDQIHGENVVGWNDFERLRQRVDRYEIGLHALADLNQRVRQVETIIPSQESFDKLKQQVMEHTAILPQITELAEKVRKIDERRKMDLFPLFNSMSKIENKIENLENIVTTKKTVLA